MLDVFYRWNIYRDQSLRVAQQLNSVAQVSTILHPANRPIDFLKSFLF